ncbi:hypothetical protein HAX54_035360, partial [Datura stramonium]|nr:hypothetical protein [Datura stramonium]
NLDVIKLVIVGYHTFRLLVQRKEEREFSIFGGVALDSGAGSDEPDKDPDEEGGNDPKAIVLSIP